MMMRQMCTCHGECSQSRKATEARVAVHERLGLVCNYYYSTIRTTQNNYYYYHSYCCCINEAGTDQDGDGQKDEWTNADRRIA